MEILITLGGFVLKMAIAGVILFSFYAIYAMKKHTEKSSKRQDELIEKYGKENNDVVLELSNLFVKHSEDNFTANRGVREEVMKVIGRLEGIKDEISFVKDEMNVINTSLTRQLEHCRTNSKKN